MFGAVEAAVHIASQIDEGELAPQSASIVTVSVAEVSRAKNTFPSIVSYALRSRFVLSVAVVTCASYALLSIVSDRSRPVMTVVAVLSP